MLVKNLSLKKLFFLGSLILSTAFIFSTSGEALAFSGSGSGLSNDPYIITNCTELQSLTNESGDSYRKIYWLGNDINCNDTANWNSGSGFDPIRDFYGTLDGRHHTITGLYINRPESYYIGLFSSLDGEGFLGNLNIVSSTVIGTQYVGTLTGAFYGVHIYGVSVSGTVSGNDLVGGLVGDSQADYNQNSGIFKSSFKGTVDSQSAGGGLVGRILGYFVIEDSFSNAAVNAQYYAGGLVGSAYNCGDRDFSRVYTAGSVSSTNFAGGLIGYISTGCRPTYNYIDDFSAATLIGGGDKGGFLGRMYGVTNINSSTFDSYLAGTSSFYGSRYNTDEIFSIDTSSTVFDSSVTSSANYLKNSSSNFPLNDWNFSSVWNTAAGNFPTLRSVSDFSGPGLVRNIVASSTGTNLTISWDSPPTSSFPIVNYLIEIKLSRDTWQTAYDYREQSSTSTTFEGFNPGFTYDFRISSESAYGSSDYVTSSATVAAPQVHNISTCNDLQNLSASSTQFDTFRLTADIDCSSVENFAPISWSGSYFQGVLDGQHHTISNLNLSYPGSDYIALFTGGSFGAQIKDLNITSSNFFGQNTVASLFAEADDFVTIDNVNVSANIVGGTYDSWDGEYVGGLIGYYYSESSDQLVINSSTVSSTIYGRDEVGGLVGSSEVNLYQNLYSASSNNHNLSYFSVTNNTFKGRILPRIDGDSYDSLSNAGGLFGDLYVYTDDDYVESNFNINNNEILPDTEIYVNNQNGGGLIGYLDLETEYTDSDINFNFGPYNISHAFLTNAEAYNGGLIGYAYNYDDGSEGTNINLTIDRNFADGDIEGYGSYNGGLIGYTESYGYESNVTNLTIKDSYFKGDITGDSQLGGLIGYFYSDSGESAQFNIDRSYAAGTVRSIYDDDYVGGLVGLADSEYLHINDSFAANKVISNNDFTGAIVGDGASNVIMSDTYYDHGKSPALYCADNGDQEGCFAANTDDTPSSTYFFNNNINPPFTGGSFNWDFDETWISHISKYPTLIGTDGYNYNIRYIADCGDLQHMADSWTRRKDNFYLTADIDCTGFDFQPLDFAGRGFGGILDGQGHTVSNLVIDQPEFNDSVGLFIYSDGATIKNISFVSSSVSGNDRVGGLVGYAINTSVDSVTSTMSVSANLDNGGGEVGGLFGYYEVNSGNNISISNSSVEADVSGYYTAGGLIGYSYLGTDYYGGLSEMLIENSHFSGTVSSSGRTNYDAGGLVADAEVDDGDYTDQVLTISNSYSTGHVFGEENVGGLVGYGFGLTISNSYSSSDVNGAFSVGGLLGYGDGTVKIQRSFASGDIAAQAEGGDSFMEAAYAGGLVGYMWDWDMNGSDPHISESYASGNVQASTFSGGLAGYLTNVVRISDTYARGNVSGTFYIGGLVGYLSVDNNSESGGYVRRSYASGDVVSMKVDAGEGPAAADVSGFIGYFDRGVALNNFTASAVSGDADNTAGFLGYVNEGGAGQITNNFYDKLKSGQTQCASGYADADLLAGNTCVGVDTEDVPVTNYFYNNNHTLPFDDGESPLWDFEDIWQKNTSDYPTLLQVVNVVPLNDDTAPEISGVSATPSSTTAIIIWTTNKNASSKVVYSPDGSYASSTVVSDVETRVSNHTVSISNLNACTSYNFKVVSVGSNSLAATSTNYSFNTAGCTAGAEIISATSTATTVSATSTSSLTDSSNTIYVTTPANFTATSSQIVIQIKSLNSTAVINSIGKPDSSLNSAASVVFDVKALIDSQTTLDSFDVPVTITYVYSDSEISSLNESSLWMYHYHNGGWLALDNCSVNTGTNTITCTAPSFSVFGLFGHTNTVQTSGGGTSYVYGCTDTKAINYNPSANISNTSQCQYAAVTTTIKVVSTTAPIAVTATSTPANELSCSAKIYLKHSVKYGAKNNNSEDVKLLQKFLNTDEGENLVVDGKYKKADFDAVVRWQEKYSDEILKPWGIVKGTGYVYTQSLKKIKQIHEAACKEKVVATKYIFSKDLKMGSVGEEVRQLQMFLNNHGYIIASSGPGSLGQETLKFGAATKKALIKFQEDNAQEILAPSNLKNGSGILKDSTRQVINKID